MRVSTKVITSMLALAGFASPVLAQDVPINGTTFACFLSSGTGCDDVADFTSAPVLQPIGGFGGGLTFDGSAFGNGDETIGGGLSIGNFGVLTYQPVGGPGVVNINETLVLRFVFSQPNGVASFLQGQSLITGIADGPSRNIAYTGFTTAWVPFSGTDGTGQIRVTVDNGNVGTNGATFQGVVNATASVVPEPSTYALMGTGLLGLAGFARRRRSA